jgi:hypothetical protein
MHSAHLNQIWRQYDGEPVLYRGVSCCLSVEEFGDGLIAVELVPQDDTDGNEWPVNVLCLPDEVQTRILNEINAGL